MSRNHSGQPNTMVQEVVAPKEDSTMTDITNEPFEHAAPTAPIISVGVDVPAAQEYTVVNPAPLSAEMAAQAQATAPLAAPLTPRQQAEKVLKDAEAALAAIVKAERYAESAEKKEIDTLSITCQLNAVHYQLEHIAAEKKLLTAHLDREAAMLLDCQKSIQAQAKGKKSATTPRTPRDPNVPMSAGYDPDRHAERAALRTTRRNNVLGQIVAELGRPITAITYDEVLAALAALDTEDAAWLRKAEYQITAYLPADYKKMVKDAQAVAA